MHRMILNETSYFGAGCRESIAIEAKRRGFKKAFFVTDKDLIRFKVADKVIEVFEKNNIPYEVYSDVKANPTIANVQNGVKAYQASGADFIVALGGGSSIDTAKGIGIVVNNPDFADVRSLEGVADTKQKAVPTFALPTGTFERRRYLGVFSRTTDGKPASLSFILPLSITRMLTCCAAAAIISSCSACFFCAFLPRKYRTTRAISSTARITSNTIVILLTGFPPQIIFTHSLL